MHIAIYSAFFSPTSITYIKTVIEYLSANGHHFLLVDRMKKHLGQEGEKYTYFTDERHSRGKCRFLIFGRRRWDTVAVHCSYPRYEDPHFGDQCRPTRLFNLIKKRYTQGRIRFIFSRKVHSCGTFLIRSYTKNPSEALQEFGFALNEVTINRKNTTSMLQYRYKIG